MNHLAARVVRRFQAESVMPTASLSEVQRAKDALKARLGQPSWLRGIGIGGRSGAYCIKVNVDLVTDEIRAAVPTEVNGILVVVTPVGQIRPQ